jgi:aspartate racemase
MTDRQQKHEVVSMKTIGLLGGMSSQATIEYYRLLNSGVQTVLGEHNAAEILLCSVNFQNIERLVRNEQWDDAGTYLAKKASCLERGGADFVLMNSNTMHRVADRIVEALKIPFLNLYDVTAKAIREQGLQRVGLLGTRPVMSNRFYRETYEERGVEVITPDEEAKQEVDRIIFDELCRGNILPTSKDYFLQVIRSLEHEGAEGIILGCTEIKLLINQSDLPNFPVFDTTTLHCQATVNFALETEFTAVR